MCRDTPATTPGPGNEVEAVPFVWFSFSSGIVNILPTVLKWPCHNQNKNICKELSQDEACRSDIGTQYRIGLHGIALKNNELNVAMAEIRYRGLDLICIL